MYPNRNNSFASSQNSDSSSMDCSLSSTSWDTSFTESTNNDSLDLSFDAVRVELQYNNNEAMDSSFHAVKLGNPYTTDATYSAMPSTHDTMASFPQDGMNYQAYTTKSMEENNLMSMVDCQPSFQGVDHNLVSRYGIPPTGTISWNSALASSQCSSTAGVDSSSLLMSRAENFVNPNKINYLDTFDLQSPMHSEFDASSISDCPTEYSFVNSPEDSACYAQSPFGSISSDATPPRSSALRHSIHEPLASSLALHKVQSYQTKDYQRRRLVMQPNEKLAIEYRHEKLARKSCPYAGCTKKFQRQEHLKRHEKTHSKTEPDQPCPFCKKHFNRGDNLKSHITLHANAEGKKSTRTKYAPEAKLWLLEYEKKSRKSNGSSSVKKEEPFYPRF